MQLTRTLHLTNPLMHGPDVGAVQALLTAKGFPVVIDQWYGPETAGACVTAKRRLGYPRVDQTPTCAQRLVQALEGHPPFPPPPLPAPRVRYVAELRNALAGKAHWSYAMVRPIPHPGHTGQIVTDCSGGVTYLAECARCPDPNGRGFDGEGFTGTLLSSPRCSHITRDMLRPGDLVVFGAYPGHHVGAVLTLAPVMLWSHGRQGDPREVSLEDEAGWQAGRGYGTLTYLRFLT